MIDIMNEIDDKLNENYKAYAGLQVLISSIPEINNIVNHGSQGDVELYRGLSTLCNGKHINIYFICIFKF